MGAQPMVFNSLAFLLFLGAFLAIFRWAGRGAKSRSICIAIGSLLFYGACDPRFVPLLVGVAYFGFLIAKALGKTQSPRHRKALLWVAIAGNLGVLAYFKYLNFVVREIDFLTRKIQFILHIEMSSRPPPFLYIVLPIGISFYIFQCMSYVIDVYRGDFFPRRRFMDVLAAISFFPHLQSGPIIRSSTLFPQFDRYRAPSRADVATAAVLFCLGLFKKTLADFLGVAADRVFDPKVHAHSALDAWTGALAFCGQAYGDLSGYTDMALAIALVLGFKLPVNFNNPFLAVSPADFWRRWHISMSTWFRDYLYLPLLVWMTRKGRGGTSAALVITMVVVGLWYGPKQTYLVYGVYNGLLIIAIDLLESRFPAIATSSSAWVRCARIVGTYYLMLLAFVIFRAETLGQTLEILRDLHRPAVEAASFKRSLATLQWVVAGLACVYGVAAFFNSAKNYVREVRYPLAACGALGVFSVILYALLTELNASSTGFLYFLF